MKTQNNYTSSDIKTLEGLDHIRTRPGMYIRDTEEYGLHHLFRECLDNAVDEALAGHADLVGVVLGKDGSCSVRDNGRGIPAGPHPDKKYKGVDTLEMIVSHLFTGGKFNNYSYKTSSGLHGVGIKAVTALSDYMKVSSFRDGHEFSQEYKKGKKICEVKKTKLEKKETGTLISFIPDGDIFETTSWNLGIIKERLQELSCLVSGVTFSLEDQVQENSWEWKSSGLIELFNAYVPEGKSLIHEPLSFSIKEKDIKVDVIFGYVDRFYQRSIKSYVNNVATHGGGKHVEGFQSGLLSFFRNVLGSNVAIKKIQEKIEPADVLEGLVGIISVYISEPKFEGQTKDKLGNTEVRTKINDCLAESLPKIFQKLKDGGSGIKQKIIDAVVSRNASQKARKQARKQNKTISLPSKLADCRSNDIAFNEIFIVEGDSAGGSAKNARDSNLQAVLPLKGKIQNVNRAVVSKIVSNQEVMMICEALGLKCQVERGKINVQTDGLRYGKIILAADADPDGSHIVCLLLTFFYNLCPDLLREERVYVVKPPLYRVKSKGDVFYFYDEQDLAKSIKKIPDPVITRFKGLGEMNPDTLAETTLNPNKRKLIKVVIDDEEDTVKMVDCIMGNQSDYRKRLIFSFDFDEE